MKPLGTTLGDAVAAKGGDLDWRTQLREAGIDRRPPPSSTQNTAPTSRPPALLVPLADIKREEDEELARLEMEEKLARERDAREKELAALRELERELLEKPAPTPAPPPVDLGRPDRGYIDQSPPPDPPPPRRRIESPTLSRPVALIRPNISPEPIAPASFRAGAPPTPPLPPPERSSVAGAFRVLQSAPPPAEMETRQLPPTPEPAMPKPQRKQRVTVPEDVRAQMARRIIAAGFGSGEAARVAKECDVSESAVSLWVVTYKQKNPKWQSEIAAAPPSRRGGSVSSPPPPPSLPQPASQFTAPAAAPPAPAANTLVTPSSTSGPAPAIAVTFTGLEEYIQWVVDQRVKTAVGKAFQQFFANMGGGGGSGQ